MLATARVPIEDKTSGELHAELAEIGARLMVDTLAQLDQLKPEEQMIIRWLDLEEKSIAEVCQATGWNSGLTRIRAFRAGRRRADRHGVDGPRGP